MVEYMPSVCKAMGSIPKSTQKKKVVTYFKSNFKMTRTQNVYNERHVCFKYVHKLVNKIIQFLNREEWKILFKNMKHNLNHILCLDLTFPCKQWIYGGSLYSWRQLTGHHRGRNARMTETSKGMKALCHAYCFL